MTTTPTMSPGTNTPRKAAIHHALWLTLVAGLLIDICIQRDISLLILLAWATVAACTIVAAKWGQVKLLRLLLLTDAFIAALLLSLAYFSVPAIETLLCYDALEFSAYRNYSYYSEALYHSTLSTLQNFLHSYGLVDQSGIHCKMGNSEVRQLSAGRTPIFEVGILAGQAAFAFYLAESTNRQILEYKRLEILHDCR